MHSVGCKTREKFILIRLFYSTQAKSLRQTLILLSMKLLAYKRLLFTKRRSGSAEKRYISIIRVKLRVKVDFLVLLRLGKYVSV